MSGTARTEGMSYGNATAPVLATLPNAASRLMRLAVRYLSPFHVNLLPADGDALECLNMTNESRYHLAKDGTYWWLGLFEAGTTVRLRGSRDQISLCVASPSTSCMVEQWLMADRVGDSAESLRCVDDAEAKVRPGGVNVCLQGRRRYHPLRWRPHIHHRSDNAAACGAVDRCMHSACGSLSAGGCV